MENSHILEIAARPTTRHFVFGSEELEEWTRKHRNSHTGICRKDSGWYVVSHHTNHPAMRSFKVLSSWVEGKCVPISYDIPS